MVLFQGADSAVLSLFSFSYIYICVWTTRTLLFKCLNCEIFVEFECLTTLSMGVCVCACVKFERSARNIVRDRITLLFYWPSQDTFAEAVQ